MRPTLKDVAKRAGVNFTLVSKLINRNPQARMTPETRARIERAIKELDYRPSASARSLRTGRSKTIGLLIGNLTNAYYAHCADLALRETHRLGYRLLIALVGEDGEKEALSSLLAGEPAGVILFADTYGNSGKLHLPCPAVICGCKTPGLSSVNFDLETPLRKALKHLETEGVKNVAGLFFERSIWTAPYRKTAEKTSMHTASHLLPFAETERREALRKICAEKPEAFLITGWQTTMMLRDLLDTEMPEYHPRMILHANSTGPFLANPDVAGIIHTSTGGLIREMTEQLSARIESSNPPEEKQLQAEFIPASAPAFAGMISKQFQLT